MAPDDQQNRHPAADMKSDSAMMTLSHAKQASWWRYGTPDIVEWAPRWRNTTPHDVHGALEDAL
jgi:hypothetical protein